MLVFGDDISRCWAQITGFQGEGGSAVPRTRRPDDELSPVRQDASPIPSFALADPDPPGEDERRQRAALKDKDLVRDERGVLLAREEEGD